MKIRDLTILLTTFFGTIAGLSTIVTVVVLLDNRGLRQETRDLRQHWDTVAGESRQLKLERIETESAFSAQGERLKQVEAELAAIRSSLLTNAPPAPQAARAHRAAVFLGQQYLGQGWVAPGQTATDPNTGQARYEPVVVLDPSIRAGIAAGKTNVIEREAAIPTTVNYNYPYPYSYYWWWPTVWPVATNVDRCGPPVRPSHGSPPATQAQEARLVVQPSSYFPRGGRLVTPIPQPPRSVAGRASLNLSTGRALPVAGARPLSSPGN